MITAGIDLGSTYVKAVVMADGAVKGYSVSTHQRIADTVTGQ